MKVSTAAAGICGASVRPSVSQPAIAVTITSTTTKQLVSFPSSSSCSKWIVHPSQEKLALIAVVQEELQARAGHMTSRDGSGRGTASSSSSSSPPPSAAIRQLKALNKKTASLTKPTLRAPASVSAPLSETSSSSFPPLCPLLMAHTRKIRQRRRARIDQQETTSMEEEARCTHPKHLFSDEATVAHQFGMGVFASPHVNGFDGIFRQSWFDFYVTEVPDVHSGPLSRTPNYTIPPLPERHAPTATTTKLQGEGEDEGLLSACGASSGGSTDLLPPPSSFFQLTTEEMIHAKQQILAAAGSSVNDTKKILHPKSFSPQLQEKIDKTRRRMSSNPLHDHQQQSNGGARRRKFIANDSFYTEAVLRKRRMAHSDALSRLSQVLRLHPGRFSVAGIKDLIGDTVQRVRILGTSPQALLHANEELEQKLGRNQMELSDFSYHDKPLFPGDLFGNHFKIVLRDVVASPEVVQQAMVSFQEHGFPNYFGCQRFSWFAGDQEPALAMLHENWLSFAYRLLNYTTKDHSLRQLLQRDRKYPTQTQDQYRRNVVRRLRNYSILPTELDQPHLVTAPSLYASRASPVKDAKTNLIYQALRDAYVEDLDLQSRRLTAQRFASYLWNQALSLRLHHFGSSEVLVGDFVIPAQFRQQHTTRESRLGVHEQMRIVTEETKHLYTIEDVVHPSFTFEGAQLPRNDVADFYLDICEKYRLDWSKRHQKGGLRDFLEPPRPILRKPMSCTYQLDASAKVLTVEFTLERGCYANVAITELLKLSRCAGSEKILVLPAPEANWEMGGSDPGYVRAVQDVYEGFEDGEGFVLDEHTIPERDQASLFELTHGPGAYRTLGKERPATLPTRDDDSDDASKTTLLPTLVASQCDTSSANGCAQSPPSYHVEPDHYDNNNNDRQVKLHLLPEEDPYRIASTWSRKHLRRNMQRRIDDERLKRAALFEAPLDQTVSELEIPQYAGTHFVPLRPNMKAKRMFFKVQRRMRQYPGGSTSTQSTVATMSAKHGTGGNKNKKQRRVAYELLNKGSWNVTW